LVLIAQIKKKRVKLSSPFINIEKILLTHQENSIGEHKFSVLPKAAEQHIVGKISDRAVAYLLYTK
jgi:hypothetical protein